MRFFSIKELCKSTTADKYNIDNTPTLEVINNLTKLVDNILDPLREAWGRPIYVNSGYRSPKLNAKVGGTSTSQHCFDDKTEILTNLGWRTIDTIELTDLVLSYNIDAHLLEYKDINSIVCYDYSGPLICAENKHVSFAVTDEHRMLCRYDSHKYKRKEDSNRKITESGQKYFDSLKTNNDQYHIEPAKALFKKRRFFKCAGISKYNNYTEYSLDELRMCMAVISDGFLHKRLYGKNSPLNISYGFNLVKERDKSELENILSNLNWHYTKNYSKSHEKQGEPNVYTYYINSTVGKNIYNIIGINKKIPRWFLYLSPEYLKKLIMTYAAFDGTIDYRNNNTGVTIFSKDKDNIDMLLQMCILCGWRSTIKKFINRVVEIKGKRSVIPEFYYLYITRGTDESRVNEERWFTEYYEGKVWCVNNDNTTLVIRRNGKVSILGNCFGMAADITTGNASNNEKLFKLIQNLKLPFDLLIDEKNFSWIHVSYGPKNRRQILKL